MNLFSILILSIIAFFTVKYCVDSRRKVMQECPIPKKKRPPLRIVK